MTTIVIEDELMQRHWLCDNLTNLIPDITIVAVADTVGEAIEKIRHHNPELVILDLNLHQQSGFEVLHHFPHRTFEVIIVTAHWHLANKVAAMGVSGYLIKPFEIHELIKTITRARHNAKQRRTVQEYQKVKDVVQAPFHRSANGNDTRQICLEEIRFIKADNAWSVVFCNDGTMYECQKQLRDWENDSIPGTGLGTFLLRVHKSYIVNVLHIKSWQNNGKDILLRLRCGQEIPVSRTYKQQFLQRIQSLP